MQDFRVVWVEVKNNQYTDCFYTLDGKPGYTRLHWHVSEQAARLSIMQFRKIAINGRNKR
jgi:hypothetical protein